MSLEENILMESAPENSFQWVAIYEENGELKELYQYINNNGEEQQTNISKVINLEQEGKLQKIYIIPKGTVFSTSVIPRIGVNLLDGTFDVNGATYDNKPIGVSFSEYRFVLYRTIHTSVGVSTLDPATRDAGSVKWYKIGWQSTVNNQNYQRVIWYSPTENTFTLREKR